MTALPNLIQKRNSKYIKELNGGMDTLNFSRKIWAEQCFEINHTNFFLASLLERWQIKLHKTNLMNLKRFCTAREALMKEKILKIGEKWL